MWTTLLIVLLLTCSLGKGEQELACKASMAGVIRCKDLRQASPGSYPQTRVVYLDGPTLDLAGLLDKFSQLQVGFSNLKSI